MKRMIENLRFDRTVIQPGAETKLPHAQPLVRMGCFLPLPFDSHFINHRIIGYDGASVLCSISQLFSGQKRFNQMPFFSVV
jgi:hypothetical protein